MAYPSVNNLVSNDSYMRANDCPPVPQRCLLAVKTELSYQQIFVDLCDIFKPIYENTFFKFADNQEIHLGEIHRLNNLALSPARSHYVTSISIRCWVIYLCLISAVSF